MRVLVSTFGAGDAEKVFRAMQMIPYDHLVLVGDVASFETKDFKRVSEAEAVSGEEVEKIAVDARNFMEMVEAVSEVLLGFIRASRKENHKLSLNISGGSKLLGDAALFAAFRLGVEAFHCDSKLTRLPVIRGATAKDRFTPAQIKFLAALREETTLDDLATRIGSPSRQAAERVMRELRKMELLEARVESGEIRIRPTGSGREVLRAVGILTSS